MRPLRKVLLSILLFSLSYTGSASENKMEALSKELPNYIDTLPSDSLARYLSNINVANFYGMAVDSVLTTIPNTPMNMFVCSCQMGKPSMHNACYLQVAYYPDLVIRIYVINFTHMPKYSATLSWDVNLFRQESIYRISVFKDGHCVNGFCKNPI